MINIPKQIREALKPSYHKRTLDTRTADEVLTVYPEPGEAITYRKAAWSVHLRKAYTPLRFIDNDAEKATDGFCGIYRNEGIPKLFVTGDSADPAVIRSTLKTVSRRMADQRLLFSFPAKNLTEENGFFYGIRMGLRIMIFIAIFVVFDLFIIPSQPEALAKGLAIAFREGNTAGMDFTGYQSLTERFMLSILGEENIKFATSVYSLVAIFVIPVFGIAVWAEIAGKQADKIRQSRLPEAAKGFIYGLEARDGILKQSEEAAGEQKKIRLYDLLRARGLKVDKTEFETLYDEMKG